MKSSMHTLGLSLKAQLDGYSEARLFYRFSTWRQLAWRRTILRGGSGRRGFMGRPFRRTIFVPALNAHGAMANPERQTESSYEAGADDKQVPALASSCGQES